MRTRDVLAAVVQRLRAAFPGWSVDRFPDDVDSYPFKDRGKAILVAYVRSNYGDVESFNPRSVTRTLELAITVLARTLVAGDGALDTVDAVRRALFGWTPELVVTTPAETEGEPPVVSLRPLGVTPLVVTSEGDVTHKGDAIWWFALTVTTQATEVAQELVEPILAGAIDAIDMNLEAS